MEARSSMRWGVVVPVKDLRRAKSRLSTRPAPQRRALMLAFSLDVVTAALLADDVGQVLVVSDDDDVRDAAAAAGADSLDPGRPGLLDALSAAVAGRTALPTAVVVADVPSLRPQDLSAALAAAALHPRSFVADAAGTGTTLLAATRGDQLDPRFGPRSRAAHAASGAVELIDPSWTRLRCDVDTEVDLQHARELGVGTHTAAALLGAEPTRPGTTEAGHP